MYNKLEFISSSILNLSSTPVWSIVLWLVDINDCDICGIEDTGARDGRSVG